MMCSYSWLQLEIVLLLALVASISADDNSKYNYYECDLSDRRSHKSSSSEEEDDGFEELYDGNMQTAVDQWIVDRAGALIRFGPIEEWDVSGVTHMWNLFKDRETFNDDISAWNTVCVTTMHGMFWGANSFNQDIGFWSTGNVENMYSMFRNAFEFNQDLIWDTSKVADMTFMFYGSSMNGDLSVFDTSNVFSMESMFQGTSYNRDISGWDVSSLVVATAMFQQNYVFNANIKHWNPKSLVLFERMFYGAESFDQKLCWNLAKDQSTKSFQVFCFSEGKFDPDCVDEHVNIDANRRCESGLDRYLGSFTDFLDDIVGLIEDIQEFVQQCFPFLPNITCFSPDSMTPVEYRGMVAMKDLQVGDRVLTASGDYQPVYSMFHSHKNKPTPYLQIHTSHSRNDTSVRPLELTPSHMLHVVGYDNPIPAWQVEVGDYLYVLSPRAQDYSDSESKSLATRNAHGKQSQVVEIQNIERKGLYNPLTPDGTIVVDDIVTSAYVSFLGTEHIRLFRDASSSSIVTASQVDDVDDGWKVMSHQTFVHLLLSPYRAMCLYVPLSLCKTANSRENGFGDAGEEQEDSDLYGRIGQNLLLLWLRQNVVVQAIIFAVLLVFFGFLNMMLNPLGLAVAFFGSSLLYCKTSFLPNGSPQRKEKTC